ncbi:MAG: VIT1/CCC1 transporter family protein, partial [Brevundimonas sp.]
LLVAGLAPEGMLLAWVVAFTLAGLAALGLLGAKAGGAPLARSAGRVLLWGALAMAVTAAIGRLFGTAVA